MNNSIDQIIMPLANALTQSDYQTREQAIKALIKLSQPVSQEPLQSAFFDSKQSLQIQAEVALVGYFEGSKWEALLRA